MLAFGGAVLIAVLTAFALTAVLALPALAWLIARTSWTERRQLEAVCVAAAAYGVAAAGALVLDLSALQPDSHPAG